MPRCRPSLADHSPSSSQKQRYGPCAFVAALARQSATPPHRRAAKRTRAASIDRTAFDPPPAKARSQDIELARIGQEVWSEVQETAALRDFDPVYVGLGSISTLSAEATRPFMSAMPLIATKAVTRSETSRCAKTGCEQ